MRVGLLVALFFLVLGFGSRVRDPIKCGRAIVRSALQANMAGKSGLRIPKHCSRLKLPPGYSGVNRGRGVSDIVRDADGFVLGRLLPPPKQQVVAGPDGIVRNGGITELWENGRKVGYVKEMGK